jgi:hypothetical protein
MDAHAVVAMLEQAERTGREMWEDAVLSDDDLTEAERHEATISILMSADTDLPETVRADALTQFIFALIDDSEFDRDLADFDLADFDDESFQRIESWVWRMVRGSA